MTTLTTPPRPRNTVPLYSPPTSGTTLGHGLAKGLGWFSIGLGLAEFLAPHAMARLTGVPHPRLLQLYGLREIAAAAVAGVTALDLMCATELTTAAES